MIPVSKAFVTRIDSSSRYMEVEVILTMRDTNGNVAHTVTLTDEEISDFDLLEEITSNEELPFGGVSANEFTFTVDNIDKRFSPSNKLGPYHSYLVPGVEVTAKLNVETTPDKFEAIPLGTFYVAEWRAPSQGIDATITAYDKLFDLREETVPMLRVTEKATVADLFTILFKSLGMLPTEYQIDPTINQVVPYGFIPEGKVSDALTTLSQAGMCTVSVNRQNKIVVKSSVGAGTPVATWTDDTQIIEIDNPEKFNAVYGKAGVGFYSPSVRRTNSLTNISNIEIKSGDTYFEKAAFSSVPVVNLEDVTVKNSAGVTLQELKYGTHQISVLLNNPTEKTQTVTMAITGIYVAFTRQELLKQSSTPLNKKQLDINNELIQTLDHAESIMNILLPKITDPFAIFEMDVRGNPAIEVGDCIRIQAPTVKIVDEVIQIYRSNLKYDGSLEGSAVGRKVI